MFSSPVFYVWLAWLVALAVFAVIRHKTRQREEQQREERRQERRARLRPKAAGGPYRPTTVISLLVLALSSPRSSQPPQLIRRPACDAHRRSHPGELPPATLRPIDTSGVSLSGAYVRGSPCRSYLIRKPNPVGWAS